MLIHDIRYFIRLQVENREGTVVARELFEDFDSMNAFIEKTWRNPVYNYAQFTLVEVIDGIPQETGRYMGEISPYISLDEEDQQEMMEDILDFFREMEEYMQTEMDLNAPSGLLHAAARKAAKKISIESLSYLCPNCLHELPECSCEAYPPYLQRIPRSLIPHVRAFARAGLHITKAELTDTLLALTFREKASLTLPDGFHFSREENTLYATFQDVSHQVRILMALHTLTEGLKPSPLP